LSLNIEGMDTGRKENERSRHDPDEHEEKAQRGFAARDLISHQPFLSNIENSKFESYDEGKTGECRSGREKSKLCSHLNQESWG
jgi:hypothetical protein